MSNEMNVFGEDVSACMQRWVGSVAVVTGASSGIGAETVKKLVKCGIHVIGMARRLNKMIDLQESLEHESGKFYPKYCDLREEENILDVFDWIEDNLGPVSILINNAGCLYSTTLMEGKTDELRAQLDVNLMALCLCTREAIKSMKKYETDGHIVHVNSVTGHTLPELPVNRLNIYPVTKAGVTFATEILRKELRELNQRIKVSSVSPGIVGTSFLENFPTILKEEFTVTPHLLPEDIADAIMFILSTPPHVQIHDMIIKAHGDLY